MKRLKIFIVIVFLLLSTLALSDKADKAYFFFQNFVKNEYDKCYSDFDETMKKALPLNKLEQIGKQIENLYGPFEKLDRMYFYQKGDYTIFVFITKFKKAMLDIIISMDKDEKIAGFWIRPSSYDTRYATPHYVKKSKFIEKDVKIGKYGLPGKICIPKGEGKFPAVVMLSGSGPNDMDETIGPNKPFKDLAWGLATEGFVTLRYDKRYRHVKPKDFTPYEEVIEDALAAIDYLAKQPYVSSIFILGHSLGAYLAPSVALASSHKITGLVLLAPPARPLEDVLYDQLEFLKQYEDIDEELIKKVELLKESKLPDEDFVLGAPAKYYYALRKYDIIRSLKECAKKGIKFFAAFANDDYQVSVKDREIFFNIFWQPEYYKHGSVVTLFPDSNHLFIPSGGVIGPQQYFLEGHVGEDVISNIVEWMRRILKNSK